jgi:hypothetical protein
MPAEIGRRLSAHPGLQDFLRAGTLSIVRVYQMTTPSGEVVTTYQEADSIEQSFRTQIEDPSDVAQLLRDHIKNTHGIDLGSQPPPEAEQVLEFFEPATPRHPGLGFSAPLQSGKTDVFRDLGHQCAGARRAEWEAFNREFGVTVHRAYVIGTPMGDFATVYFEAPDPVEANRRFAADTSGFGTYFKRQVEEAFGIDFNQPLPPIRLVFETQTARARA